MNDQDIGDRQRAMVDGLVGNGTIRSARVERAFRAVPRHPFLPDVPIERVYSDTAIVTRTSAAGLPTSSSSQPSMMAIMLEQLDLQPGQNVLEIGTGAGYNAALLGEIVGPRGRVVSVDIQPDLVEQAAGVLQSLGYTWVHPIAADGGYGWPPGAPYDRVILTVASAVIAPAWREQLVDGGRLVMPLEFGPGMQKSVAFERRGDLLESLSTSGCGFMTLQGAFSTSEQEHFFLTPEQDIWYSAAQPPPVNEEQILTWLAGPRALIPTGVGAAVYDVLRDLNMWLLLALPGAGVLYAYGSRAEEDLVPPMIAFEGERRMRIAAALVGADGMAVLQRCPGCALPYSDMNRLDADRERFEIYIRELGAPGAERGVSSRLFEAVTGWERAGRPDSDTLQVRVLPPGAPLNPAPGEHALQKPWTPLIISYAGSQKGKHPNREETA